MSVLRVKGWSEPAEKIKRHNRYKKLLTQAQETLLQAFLVLRPIVDARAVTPQLMVYNEGDHDQSIFVESGQVYRLQLSVRLFTQEVGRDGLAVYEYFTYVIHQGNEKDAEARVLALLVQTGIKCLRTILAEIVLRTPGLKTLDIPLAAAPVVQAGHVSSDDDF